MRIVRFSSVGTVSGLVLALASGCSGGGNGTDTGTGPTSKNGDPSSQTSAGADGGPGATSSAKFTCCLNDVYYVCPDKAAVDACAGGAADVGECMANCSGDPACMKKCDAANAVKPDPSACTKQTGQKCPASPSPSPKALCANVGSGSCNYDTQCGTGRHCTGGACYDNESGSKCSYDTQCGTGNHCTDGCCQDNGTGTTCSYDTQCGSGNHCTSGKCYANESGSPCSYDTQCGSGSYCSSGKCQ